MDFTLKHSQINSASALPTASQLTKLMTHGGAYSILDPALTKQRLLKIQKQQPSLLTNIDIEILAEQMLRIAQSFFFRIVDNKPYEISNPLIVHLTQAITGRTYSEDDQPNSAIPTFITFIGQFIDHDLTLNMVNLAGGTGDPGDVINVASPYIDLDSVYGNRSALTNGDMWNIFNNTDGKFKLRKLGKNAYDLPRDVNGKAFIYDARNDENQIILQIHILVMRLHNKLAEQWPWRPNPDDSIAVSEFIEEIKTEVIRTWQSFIWHQYLPTLISEEPLKSAQNYVLNHPERQPNGMPHEFSIGFRMGHTQLRSHYKLNDHAGPIPLFDNQNPVPNDLRGDRPLTEDHVIDWAFFTNSDASGQTSNLLDGKVTSAVFSLPPSAIPDEAKEINNLPQRNLMRSSQVNLASAEDIFHFFKLDQSFALMPYEIESDIDKQKLFRLDNEGRFSETNEFRTPLWYYVIKEAEIKTSGNQLGPLGGRIIGEVIAAGIFHQPKSFLRSANWKSVITGQPIVFFHDILKFIDES